jgi:hypothetical protein
VAVYVTLNTLETYTRLKGQYVLGAPSRTRFKFRSRVLAPHISIGGVSGSSVAVVLGNKLVNLGMRCCLRLCTLSTYSFGVELSYIISYLPSLRQAHLKQHDVESLTLAAEQCDNEEVVQSVSHVPLGEVFRPRCDSYGVGRLSGMA